MNTDKKLVLIADDDADYLFQMKLRVEGFGYQVITADSAAEAEEILKDRKPDLAIFDLMMETDDSGFVLSYKAKKLYPDLPIIIATAAGAETGINFGIDTDADKQWIKADLMLDKGIREDQLHREMSKLLKL